MNQSLKIRKMILFVSTIVVVILILIIGITLFQKEKGTQQEIQTSNTGNITPTSYEKQIVVDHSTFFSVAECVQKYFNNLSFDTSEIRSTPVKGSKMRSAATIYSENQNIVDEDSKKEAIYNVLNPQYRNQNHITKDNILDKIEEKEEVKLIPLKMYQLIGETRNTICLICQNKRIRK